MQPSFLQLFVFCNEQNLWRVKSNIACGAKNSVGRKLKDYRIMLKTVFFVPLSLRSKIFCARCKKNQASLIFLARLCVSLHPESGEMSKIAILK